MNRTETGVIPSVSDGLDSNVIHDSRPHQLADLTIKLVVHVKNSMQNNGSSIHWHGIRQNHTNMNDGVTAVTQCPTAPGDEMTCT